MIEKKKFSEISQKKKGIKLGTNQFDHFWEVKCPDCGRTIDLEILVNLMRGDKK